MFSGVWTDDGFCFMLDIREELLTAGPDSVLELIVDTATYEAIPTFPTSGLRVAPPSPPSEDDGTRDGILVKMAVHEPETFAVMSDMAFDVAAGTQTMVGLSVEKNTRISREDHPCVVEGEAELNFLPGPLPLLSLFL